ncbi:MAG: hypothetical protein KDB79_14050 [Acidobacteria bacterium]|nr:hypothetical protein [Acidobacteriota bacterium]
MPEKLEVSFNSPQCGWMSIGFEDGKRSFQTTTAYAPHSSALSELLKTLIEILKQENFTHTLKWNRDPEEYDFIFARVGDETSIEIIEYPTDERDQLRGKRVFLHRGDAKQIAEAFLETFRQLYDERNVDEFEQNWHQKFPYEEFIELKGAIENYG